MAHGRLIRFNVFSTWEVVGDPCSRQSQNPVPSELVILPYLLGPGFWVTLQVTRFAGDCTSLSMRQCRFGASRALSS